MQGEQYLANAREHRLEREASPSLSEAPVCCPTCRVECYANPETGDPILLRLFLNFDDRHDDSGSSMIGSSPVQARTESRAENEELFAIARKAKALTADVKSLNARASVAEVETACTRGLALKEDATKTKAIQAVKVSHGIQHFCTTLRLTFGCKDICRRSHHINQCPSIRPQQRSNDCRTCSPIGRNKTDSKRFEGAG